MNTPSSDSGEEFAHVNTQLFGILEEHAKLCGGARRSFAGDVPAVRSEASRMAASAKAWIGPFRASFPDVHMRVVNLVAEGDKVAARFLCSGTQRGTRQGHPASGQRFERVAEVYFFELHEGRITRAWGWRTTCPGCGNSSSSAPHERRPTVRPHRRRLWPSSSRRTSLRPSTGTEERDLRSVGRS